MSNQEEITMLIEERKEFMLSINSNQTPSSRIAHFLKPTFDPRKQTLPKPRSLPSSSLKPNIQQLKKKVSFRGRPKPQKNWDTWVQNLQKTHQNLQKTHQDNSKGVLPCLPSPSNVAIDSGFDDSVWEGYIESIPSCEKNNSRNTSQVDNYEVMPSQSLHVAIEEAVGEMDSQMEQVARYREKCVNMSVMRSLDSVAEKHVETVPSCDKSVSLGRICEDTPSQIMQKVCNDVEMTESEKHEELAADKIYKSKEESAKKNLGLVADDDEQDKSHKTAKDVKIKSGDGLFGDPVIINDDNDDIGAELEARISKLERKFARMKSRKLKSKAK